MFIDTNFALQAYAPVLLERKAVAIRKAMDKEKAPWLMVRIAMDAPDKRCVHLDVTSLPALMSGSWKSIFSKALVRPFKLFIYEPIVQLLGLYTAFVYGLLYCMSSEPPQLCII